MYHCSRLPRLITDRHQQSYHSIVVPMRLAKATLRDEWRDCPPRLWCVMSRLVSGSR
jgi:hypothetical protein